MTPHLITFYLLCLIDLFTAFSVVSYSQHEQILSPGSNLTLTCKADSAWEFCLWKHSNKEVGERDCLLEWKRAKGGVSVQKCHEELDSRVTISGDYDSHECGLTVTGLEVEDAGTWECEMEEYKFGDWVSGEKHSQDISVSVQYKTTTTTPTTTAYSTTAYTTTTITTITEEVSETIIDDKEKNENSTGIYIDEVVIAYNRTEETVFYEDDIEALPIADRDNTQGSSTGMIVGVLVAISALVLAAIVGAVFWKKKRRNMGVIALHKLKDDTLAANAFLEEAEYHISIIKDPQN